MLFFGLSIILQNIVFLNSINSLIPVGLLALIIISIAIISHLYQVLKWYLYVMRTNYNNNHKPLRNIIMHACLYLIIIAIVLSIPFNLGSIKNMPDTTALINPPVENINKIKDNLFTTNYYPQINGANKDEQTYIMIILNNSKQEVRNKITSVNLVSDSDIILKCQFTNGIGCAYSDGRIYIVHLSFWNSPHLIQDEYVEPGSGYVRCSTFAWMLNHEIGHIKGFMVGDESEVFAENYAYDHTTVNLVYEPEKKC